MKVLFISILTVFFALPLMAQSSFSEESDVLIENSEFSYQLSYDNELFRLTLNDSIIHSDEFGFEVFFKNHYDTEQTRAFLKLDTLEIQIYGPVDPELKEFKSSLISVEKCNDSILFVNDIYDSWFVMSDVIRGDPKTVKSLNNGSVFFRKNVDNRWEGITEYYTSIYRAHDNYIVTTESQNTVPIEVNIESIDSVDWNHDYYQNDNRYLLLKDNLEARSFIDYFDFSIIEDLGFAFKVCTEKGCMLVTYKGTQLTGDNWEDFKIENGEIIGYKLIFEETNEHGADVYLGVQQVFQDLNLEDLDK